MFNYAYSNPPYQRDSTGSGRSQGQASEIYHLFQYLASALSERTTMIYPKHWMNHLTMEPATVFYSSGLSYVGIYVNDECLFPTIHKEYPLSITVFENGYKGDIAVERLNDVDTQSKVLNNRDSDRLFDNDFTYSLFNSVADVPKLDLSPYYLVNTSNQEMLGWENFGYNTVGFNSPVAVYLKRSAGKQPDGEWVVCEKDFISRFPKVNDTFGKYKVVTQSRIFGRAGIWERSVVNSRGNIESVVLGPREFAGTTWGVLGVFDTETEANNFSNYLNLRFVTELIGLDFSSQSFGSQVPDLLDYTNGNPLFTPDNELPVDHPYFGYGLRERLFDFFGFDDMMKRKIVGLGDLGVNPNIKINIGRYSFG